MYQANSSKAADDDGSLWSTRQVQLRTWLILLGVLILAGGARHYRMGEVNYWFDETFSFRLPQFSFNADFHAPNRLTFSCRNFMVFHDLCGEKVSRFRQDRALRLVCGISGLGCFLGFQVSFDSLSHSRRGTIRSQSRQ